MPAETTPKTRLRLRVTAAAEAALRGGHPWLFAESIREQNRQGAAGELAVVYDRSHSYRRSTGGPNRWDRSSP